MIQFFLTVFLTFLTIIISLFFLSKRRLVDCFTILTGLCFLALLGHLFEDLILSYLCSTSVYNAFFEDLILPYLYLKFIYNAFFELLNVILWLMFIGIFFAGSRDDYRGKGHLDPEGEVDSTPENTYANVIGRHPWVFEDDYVESMDWPGYEDDYFKSSSSYENEDNSKTE